MALLFLDGFDHYGASGATFLPRKWATIEGAAVATDASAARTGPYGLLISAGAGALTSRALPASGLGVVVGIAFKATSGFPLTQDVLQVREGSTVHVAVGTTAGGLLTVKRGSTVLATGATVLGMSLWYYLELHAVLHDSFGSYTLRIDGLVELSNPSLNMRNGATGLWNRVRIGGAASYDDCYICDQTGAAPHNTLLGICQVETLLPDTGNGTNVGLTPSTGTDHGALVRENPPNTTDYNGSATVAAKDTYAYPSLSVTGTVLGLQTNLYAAKSDTGARTLCAVVRTGGTDYDGANVSPLTTYDYFSEVRALNPNTGVAWTAADIAALEAGMKVTA